MHQHYGGRLTAHDCKRHIPHPFTVPTNGGPIDIRLHYTPAEVYGISNLITLTVFDPHGFRGAGHRGGADHRVHIAVNSATPGYLPGSCSAGTWTVQIDTHMIMPGEDVHYELDIDIGENARGEIENLAASRTRRKDPLRGAGWYRGDLHSHTYHSDADERSVAELIQTARDARLDFIFLTDHNTTAGLVEMDAWAGEDLLTAGGLELTTFWGHALCLGTREWVDWRVRPGTGEMARLANNIYARDQVLIIAHPQSVGEPTCTGCTWRFGDMMPGTARCVEIWNGPWGCDSNNEQALALWYDWLNQGLHLVGTAGSDTHGNQDYAGYADYADYAAHPGFNVVYAENLSESAILKALRAGHLYLSTGPQVGLQARNADGEQWMMGDTIAPPVTLTVRWAECPSDAQVRVIANGRLLTQQPAGPRGEYAWDMAPDQSDWVLVEIRGTNGEMLAITNPMFMK
jgi:hypothetical protein